MHSNDGVVIVREGLNAVVARSGGSDPEFFFWPDRLPRFAGKDATVIARLDRATEYSRDAVIESGGRGVLDTPHARGMTAVVRGGVFAKLCSYW